MLGEFESIEPSFSASDGLSSMIGTQGDLCKCLRLVTSRIDMKIPVLSRVLSPICLDSVYQGSGFRGQATVPPPSLVTGLQKMRLAEGVVRIRLSCSPGIGGVGS